MAIDPRLVRRAAWAVPVGLVALAGARWWRGYEWQLAVLTGLSIGVLAFVALRTLDRMRDLLRKPE